MQENQKFIKSRLRLPILFYPENSETKLRGDNFKDNVKRHFIKDCLINLQISLSQNNAEAWRLEGLIGKVWMLFSQIQTGLFQKSSEQTKYCQTSRYKPQPDFQGAGKKIPPNTQSR